jgi:hypothetical protein
MRITNWIIGIVGVISLTATLVMQFSRSDKIRMKTGTSYYHEAPNGYGIVAAMKPSHYDPSFHVPTYEFILFNGSIANADSFHSPVVIQADENSALVYIDSTKRRDASMTVFHSKDPAKPSYVRIGKWNNDGNVTYVDIDGDFIPDRRVTNYRGKQNEKIEAIRYTFDEIKKETE